MSLEVFKVLIDLMRLESRSYWVSESLRWSYTCDVLELFVEV